MNAEDLRALFEKLPVGQGQFQEGNNRPVFRADAHIRIDGLEEKSEHPVGRYAEEIFQERGKTGKQHHGLKK